MAKQMMDIGLSEVSGGEDLTVSAAGDFVNVESSNEHGLQLLWGADADFKQNPTCCVGVWNFEDATGWSDLLGGISAKFQADGMDVTQVGLNSEGELVARGYYK